MKKSSAIWNSFLSATFCALLALFAIVPTANCCCILQADTQAKVSSTQETHDCCKTSDESIESSMLLRNHLGECACIISAAVLSEPREIGTSTDSNALSALLMSQDNQLADDNRVSVKSIDNFRLLALRNDELKPSRIYLLNRALLN